MSQQDLMNTLATGLAARIKSKLGLRLIATHVLTGSGNFTPDADTKLLEGYVFGAGQGGALGYTYKQTSFTGTQQVTGGYPGSITAFSELVDSFPSVPIPYVCGVGSQMTVSAFTGGGNVSNGNGSLPAAGGESSFGTFFAEGGVSATFNVHNKLDKLLIYRLNSLHSLRLGNPHGMSRFVASAGANSLGTNAGGGVTTPAVDPGKTNDVRRTITGSNPAVADAGNNPATFAGANGITGLAGIIRQGEGGHGGWAGQTVRSYISSSGVTSGLVAGDGGNGGFPGGGGGPGGSLDLRCSSSGISVGSFKGGDGGKGGDGAVYVEEWG